MADESDVLLKLIEEQWAQARQSEEQRATMTNFIIVVAAAILGFIVDKGLTKEIWPLTLALTLLGLYGAIASAKFYERFNLHVHRIGKMIGKLDEFHPSANIRQLQKTADEEHKSEFRTLSTIRLNMLWLILHLVIATTGLLTTIIIFR